MILVPEGFLICKSCKRLVSDDVAEPPHACMSVDRIVGILFGLLGSESMDSELRTLRTEFLGSSEFCDTFVVTRDHYAARHDDEATKKWRIEAKAKADERRRLDDWRQKVLATEKAHREKLVARSKAQFKRGYARGLEDARAGQYERLMKQPPRPRESTDVTTPAIGTPANG